MKDVDGGGGRVKDADGGGKVHESGVTAGGKVTEGG